MGGGESRLVTGVGGVEKQKSSTLWHSESRPSARARRSHGIHLPEEQVLGELLALDAAAVAAGQLEAGVEQTRDGLHRVDLAVAVEREADDVARVVVPGDARARVQQRLRSLGERLVDDGALAGQHDALAEVGADVQRHALVRGARHVVEVVGAAARPLSPHQVVGARP
jgi:hypothetical protein